MENKAEETPAKGDLLILKPEEGKNFWQPVPANGHISVRISPDFLGVETPFSLGTQTLPPQGYVREHAHPVHDLSQAVPRPRDRQGRPDQFGEPVARDPFAPLLCQVQHGGEECVGFGRERLVADLDDTLAERPQRDHGASPGGTARRADG